MPSLPRKESRTATREDLVEIFLPITVKHLIGFVDDHVPKSSKTEDGGTLHHVDETTRRCDQDVAPLAQLSDLIAHRPSAIDDAGPKHAPVTELASFIENLHGQLAGRADDDYKRLSTNRIPIPVSKHGRIRAAGRKLLGLAHQLVQDGDQISSRLARA